MSDDIGGGLNSYLLAQATVRAIASDRGYPDELPKGCLFPAYTYSVISDESEMHLTGSSDVAQARVQFDFFGKYKKDVTRLAKAVRKLIHAKRGTWGDVVVRTCKRENSFTSSQPPIDGSDSWRHQQSEDYMLWYLEDDT